MKMSDDIQEIVRSPIFQNLFGGEDTKPIPKTIPEPKIKFMELKKGANKVKVINPNPLRRHFNTPKTESLFGSLPPPAPVFLHIGMDNFVRIRMLSNPIPYMQSYQIRGETQSLRRYLTHVLDWEDNTVKVWSFGNFILQKIQERFTILPVNTPLNQDMIVEKYLHEGFPSYTLAFCRPSIVSFQAESLLDLRALIEASPNMSFCGK